MICCNRDFYLAACWICIKKIQCSFANISKKISVSKTKLTTFMKNTILNQINSMYAKTELLSTNGIG